MGFPQSRPRNKCLNAGNLFRSDHRKYERKRGKTEIGAREKPNKCAFINGLSLWSTGTQSHWRNFWETCLWIILPGNGSLGHWCTDSHTGQKIALGTSPSLTHPCQKLQFQVHSGTSRGHEISHISPDRGCLPGGVTYTFIPEGYEFLVTLPLSGYGVYNCFLSIITGHENIKRCHSILFKFQDIFLPVLNVNHPL